MRSIALLFIFTAFTHASVINEAAKKYQSCKVQSCTKKSEYAMAEQLHTDLITIVNQREDKCHRIGVDVVINSDYKIKKEKYSMFSECIKQVSIIRKDAFKACTDRIVNFTKMCGNFKKYTGSAWRSRRILKKHKHLIE